MDIEDRDIWHRFKFSLTVFLLVIFGGTIGFWLLEDGISSLLDSFLFTLVTVTTIGYGNITPHTVAGKILDISVILLGVGAAFVAIQTVFEVVIRKKVKEVLKLPKGLTDKKNHFIVCGYGKVGKALVKRLQKEKAQFVVIENDTFRVKEMVQFNIPVIEGDAQKEDDLERAGIKAAKCLFASLDDSSNVFIALTAKMLNPSLKVVCKIEDAMNEAKLKKAGADDFVYCHDLGAQMMIKFAQIRKDE